MSHVWAQSFGYDTKTRIGYFEGDIIPGTTNALVTVGDVTPTGSAFNQQWTAYTGISYLLCTNK